MEPVAGLVVLKLSIQFSKAQFLYMVFLGLPTLIEKRFRAIKEKLDVS